VCCSGVTLSAGLMLLAGLIAAGAAESIQVQGELL
jgi:hypothetical protein